MKYPIDFIYSLWTTNVEQKCFEQWGLLFLYCVIATILSILPIVGIGCIIAGFKPAAADTWVRFCAVSVISAWIFVPLGLIIYGVYPLLPSGLITSSYIHMWGTAVVSVLAIKTIDWYLWRK